jgi:hypothetical protein
MFSSLARFDVARAAIAFVPVDPALSSGFFALFGGVLPRGKVAGLACDLRDLLRVGKRHKAINVEQSIFARVKALTGPLAEEAKIAGKFAIGAADYFSGDVHGMGVGYG